MRNTLTILSWAMMVAHGWSQSTLTVCNLPDCPSQYPTLAVAMQEANPGDIIQVMPSPLSYGDLTIDKAITIQGGGHDPDPLSGTFPILGSLQVGASNIRIEGLRLESVELIPNLGEVIANVEILNNRFYGSGRFVDVGLASSNDGTHSWNVQGNVMTPDAAPNSTPIVVISDRDSSWTIQNNYIEQHWAFQRVIEGDSPDDGTHTLVFSHNLVYTGPSGAFTIAGGLDVACSSNLFWVADTAYSFEPTGENGIDFINNLMYSPVSTLVNPDDVYDNLMNAQPLFADIEGGVPTWNVTSNFALAAGSPGIGDGMDGSDVGLYGNLFAFNNRGVPAGIPALSSLSKTYDIVPLGEPLEIQVEWTVGQ